jgi:hypothetical protein
MRRSRLRASAQRCREQEQNCNGHAEAHEANVLQGGEKMAAICGAAVSGWLPGGKNFLLERFLHADPNSPKYVSIFK